MPRETLTRLMTGIFIAQVAVKSAADILLYAQPIRRWPEAIPTALETTIRNDAFYMPAAVALMQHYQS
jgi:hypothetical protein